RPFMIGWTSHNEGSDDAPPTPPTGIRQSRILIGRRRASGAVSAVAFALVIGTTSAPARAVDRAACAAASDQAQQLRDEAKLRAARAQLIICADETCPGVIRKDCAGWLADVEARLPSVVFRVLDPAGKDLVQVKLTVDGKKLTDTLDGK